MAGDPASSDRRMTEVDGTARSPQYGYATLGHRCVERAAGPTAETQCSVPTVEWFHRQWSVFMNQCGTTCMKDNGLRQLWPTM